MSTWNEGVYTQQGLTLLSKLTQGASLNVSRITYGTGIVDESQLTSQTSVSGEKGELTAQTPSYPEVGQCKLPLYLSNNNITQAFTVHQIGLYTIDPDVGEVLYFISQSTSGTSVPSVNVAPGFTATWTFNFKYGQAANVNITVDPNNAVTPDMLDEVYKEMEKGASVTDKGENVVTENNAELPFTKLNIYGKSKQNGIPNPDYAVDIEGIGESLSLSLQVFGKQLLIYPYKNTTETVNGLTFTDMGDGSIKINGTAESTTFFHLNDLPKLNGKVVIGGCPQDSSYATCYLGVDKDSVNIVNVYGNETIIDCVDSSVYGLVIIVRSGATISNQVFTPYAELYGVNNSEYEPFKEIQEITLTTGLPLHGVENSVGHYTDKNGVKWWCDEINLVGKTHNKRMEIITLSGSSDESWYFYNTENQGICFYVHIPDSLKGNKLSLCDKFENVDMCWTTPYMNKYGIYSDHPDGTYKYFRAPHAEITTLEAWKEWLNDNPIKLVYALAESIITLLSNEEIEVIKTLHSNNPNTIVLNTESAEMEVECVANNFENVIQMVLNNAGGNVEIEVDTELSTTSENPVQNKAVNAALAAKAPAYTYSTTDLTAGSSSLETGKLYILYE